MGLPLSRRDIWMPITMDIGTMQALVQAEMHAPHLICNEFSA